MEVRALIGSSALNALQPFSEPQFTHFANEHVSQSLRQSEMFNMHIDSLNETRNQKFFGSSVI